MRQMRQWSAKTADDPAAPRVRPVSAPALARLERLLPAVHDLGGDGPWLADVLFRWLEDRHRGASLEAYLGVLPLADGVDPVARRTELVQALAARLYPGLARSAQAKVIAQAAKSGERHQELIELSELAAQSRQARWPLCWRQVLTLLQS